MLALSVKSKVSPNENMANSLRMSESINVLEYLIPEYAKDRTIVNHDFLGPDGQVMIDRVFAKWNRILSGKEEPDLGLESDYDCPPESYGLTFLIDPVLTDVVVTNPQSVFARNRWTKDEPEFRRMLAFMTDEGLFPFPLPADRDEAHYSTVPAHRIEFEESYFHKFFKGLSKWRSLKLQEVMFLDGNCVINVKETRITSSEIVPSNKKRASWFIEYKQSKEQISRRKTYPGEPDVFVGEVLFYLEAKLPVFEGDGTDDVPYEFVLSEEQEGKIHSERVILAYVEDIPLEAIRVGHKTDADLDASFKQNHLISNRELYILKRQKMRGGARGRKRFVDSSDIVGLVGFAQNEVDGEFVVWENQGAIRKKEEHFNVIFQ